MLIDALLSNCETAVFHVKICNMFLISAQHIESIKIKI